MIGCIYKITSPSGKCYIGLTKNIEIRFKSYRLGHCKKQLKLYKSIKKYGWDFHEKEIIYTIPYNIDALYDLEIVFIKKFNSFINGLNSTPGGKFGFISDENRKKTSIRMKKGLSEETKQKIRLANIGKKQSDETRLKRSISSTGHKKSEETRRRMSESKKGVKFSDTHIQNMKMAIRKPITEETRQKLSLASKGKKQPKFIGNNFNGKPVIDISNGTIFKSLVFACKTYNLKYPSIKKQLLGYETLKTTLRRYDSKTHTPICVKQKYRA